MAVSPVYEPLIIQSHTGPYTVVFDEHAFARLPAVVSANAHFIIDARVAKLYADDLESALASPSVLLIEATETHKSLDQFTSYVEHLVACGVRRGHVLVAIGGGIIQDITCFLAATMLRGLEWHFYPTTLLAQADSCIGSKSSINVGKTKNVMGTFTPPTRVTIDGSVLATLDECDIRSGIGEMLKVQAIDGPESFDRIASDYRRITTDSRVMMQYVYQSLAIKRGIIETDEFDRGPRNLMNYGHSFGHAVESATDFAVPHGIAVTIGMDMANYTAVRFGLMDRRHYERMHPTLATNYAGFEHTRIPLDAFLAALTKDKKNADDRLSLILPDAGARVFRGSYANDAVFRTICAEYLAIERGQ